MPTNSENNNTVSQIAIEYKRNGISIIPVKADGSKKPAIEWKPYQRTIATDSELDQWFIAKTVGIGIITGKVSQNLEVIDFDAPETFGPWKQRVIESGGGSILSWLVIVKSPGGWHVVYRCPSGIQGNQRLALRKAGTSGKSTMIETRGEGGYVVAPGSPGSCHPSGKCYELVQSSFDAVAEITSEERKLLLDAARYFSSTPDEIVTRRTASSSGRFRPGDDFNDNGSWGFLLEAGWKAKSQTPDGTIHIQRPGKYGAGTSATIGFAGLDNLYVFSSNANPFEPGRSYSKFAAYAYIKYRGNFKEAARDLAEQGYGSCDMNDLHNAAT